MVSGGKYDCDGLSNCAMATLVSYDVSLVDDDELRVKNSAAATHTIAMQHAAPNAMMANIIAERPFHVGVCDVCAAVLFSTRLTVLLMSLSCTVKLDVAATVVESGAAERNAIDDA